MSVSFLKPTAKVHIINETIVLGNEKYAPYFALIKFF